MTTTDLRTAPPPGSRPGPRPAPAAPGRTGARHAGPPRPLTRFWRGPLLAPRWERPALLALLVGTALLYLWDLGATGTANSFYAAAVQAGTQSWKALLFGSLDSSNFITVDKPPASLWVMGLSGRIFGFNAWSMLVPEALMGVGSVALLRLAVRRWAGPGAGLVAGAALALTPVAVLMFRFDNPDAMLVLCMTAAAYAAVRAVDAAAERAGVRWIALTGALLGLGFLTKMLQAWLVLPAFVAVIVLVAAVTWRRRLLLLGAGLVALVVSVGWYVLLVDLWPTSSRPYIGGSTDNSFLDLVLGYNGLGRIVGGEGNGGGSGGGPGGGTGNTGFGGSTGITRMFNESFGGQISWLLPAALIVLVAGLWLTRRAPRTDRTRAALVLWGGWLLVNGLVFSFMSGTVHAYYSVAMAPGLAGTLAVGGMVAWRRREELVPRLALVAALATTTAWSVVLLRRTPEFLPWLRWVVAVGGAVAVLVVLVGLVSRRAWSRRALPVVLLAALLAGASGSVAYAMDTAATAHTGSIVSAGPSTGNGMGMGGPGGGGRGGPGGGTPPSGERPAGGQQGGQGGGGQGGGPGGTTASAALTSLLRDAGTRWSAAAVGSQSAAPLELSSGTAVMAIGGFSGSDATPTLAQFQALVASGDIHYFLGSGDGGGMGGQGGSGSVGSQITAWVTAHYTATTVGGTTVYDLTAPTS